LASYLAFVQFLKERKERVCYMPRIWIAVLDLLLALSAITPGALAQSNSYKQSNLTSDTAGVAANVDPNLVNPWGIAFFPNNPFWIADNNSGFTTLYNASGMNVGSFPVPAAAANTGQSAPTGIVANIAGKGFAVNGKPGLFLFDSEDGAIRSWNGSDPVTIKVDNSRMGAVYKGLALITNASGAFLLAANFDSGAVEVYDSLFNVAHLAGAFADPNLPSGFAPFGIHVVNGQVLVTYAMQDQAKHDPVRQAGAGYVDLFDMNGNFVQRLVSQGNLNAPWGATVPPAGFGAFGGKLLIGNFGDGTINAFDRTAGTFIDQMKDSSGAVVTNASLWDMVFGGGGTSGDPNTLYITAGLSNEQHGLFAAITANASTPAATADFSLSASPATAGVMAGGSASVMLNIGGLNGFNSAVTFSCSGEPANTSCTFNPNTVTPSSGGTVTTSMTIATTKPGTPYHPMITLPMSGREPWSYLAIPLLLIAALALRKFALAGAGNLPFGRRRARSLGLVGGAALMLGAASWLMLSGCGGGSNNNAANPGTPTGTTTLVVTATSGSISHSTNITLTVE
jgi:uncharacterized protein (TIGR03118 family)